MLGWKKVAFVAVAAAVIGLGTMADAHARSEPKAADGRPLSPGGRLGAIGGGPEITGALGVNGPTSDQIRGPVHDDRTGRVRPGNPSPSVR